MFVLFVVKNDPAPKAPALLYCICVSTPAGVPPPPPPAAIEAETLAIPGKDKTPSISVLPETSKLLDIVTGKLNLAVFSKVSPGSFSEDQNAVLSGLLPSLGPNLN